MIERLSVIVRRSIRRSRHGQSLVETAITLSILLTIIFGGVAAIQAIGAHYTVSQAVRIAVHQAALRGATVGMDGRDYNLKDAPGPAAEAARAAFEGSVFADPQHAVIQVRCASSCRRYDPVTVTIRYRADVWTPIPGILTDIRVERSATRTLEQDVQP